ncbi:MAG: hypothetical protein WA005_00515 [Candidatus Binataceae bacterium]
MRTTRDRIEVILAAPPYLARSRPHGLDGFGDVSFFAKYRILSANEEQGI